ncbi:MAG: transketolase, partial [Bacteroidota bacterium]
VRAWQDYQSTNDTERDRLLELMDGISDSADIKDHFRQEIESLVHPTKSELVQIARRMTFTLHASEIELPQVLTNYILEKREAFENDYGTELLASGHQSPLNVPVIHPSYADNSSSENGYQIINRYFDSLMERRDDVFAFGEDVGKIGDVNQGMAGLQEKYGEHRVFDTGIREWTILGQGAGLAMRGLRAIAEIQYLDYLVYALPFLMDDVATARYRSAGQQQKDPRLDLLRLL